jgi:hypothetical protein
MLAAPTTWRDTAGLRVPIPTLLFVASTKKVLEMLAVIPDEEAISNNVSGVTSPSPNLPVEVDEKMANLVPVLSKISTSAVKEAPFLNSQ